MVGKCASSWRLSTATQLAPLAVQRDKSMFCAYTGVLPIFSPPPQSGPRDSLLRAASSLLPGLSNGSHNRGEIRTYTQLFITGNTCITMRSITWNLCTWTRMPFQSISKPRTIRSGSWGGGGTDYICVRTKRYSTLCGASD